MSFPGSAPPPDGVVPNLDHPTDVLKTCLYVTQGLTIALSTAFVAMRVYAKFRIFGGDVTWDDCATYTSFVLMIGYCTTACFAAAHGGGLNQWEVRKDEIQKFFQSGYAATIFYAPMALAVKLSLVLIIIRVFGSVHRKTMIGVYIFVIVITLYYVSGLFIKIFICWPIDAYWKGESEKCMDQSAIITADAIISVISDLVILLLPTPLTWSLQLPLRKRLRVIGMLCAGGVATGFSIYRLALILRDGKSSNQTIVFTKVILSGNAEAGIGLICACLPSINAFVVRRRRGSEYYAQTGSSRKTASQGGIMLTRSYQVNSSRNIKTVHGHDCEVGSDQAELVYDAQDNPRTNTAGRGSVSTN
ncbi:integral membrane protein [Mariannaea sp. PMI_226]|nr:integral membrane protein [Mariannaea sp. PMI_226]